jgi:hypothetical protein
VRKALEHLPKGQAAPKATSVAGFKFQKTGAPQDAPAAQRPARGPWQNPAAPTVPDLAHAQASPSLATSSISFTSVTGTPGDMPASAIDATAIAPNVMNISSLREKIHQNQSAIAIMVQTPAAMAPRPGNMTIKTSQRWIGGPEVFDELNHVYLHEPDPVLVASFPLAGIAATLVQPVATAAKPRHTATAGPSGAGRVEFFPMQPRLSVTPLSAEAEEALPELAARQGDHIWLEDFMSWRIPVALAPNRSSMAMLPATDRMAALERLRDAHPASAARPAPLAWQFETSELKQSTIDAASPAVAPAMIIEFPAPRDGASAPLSVEAAILDAQPFRLQMPDISVEAGELDLLLMNEMAEVAPAQTDSPARETILAHHPDWFPMQAETLLPVSTPELLGALAEPKIGADLTARSLPSPLRNGAKSINPGLPISLPYCAVRLKNGPDFFAAEPVVADSAARPVASRPYAAPVALAVPEMPLSAAGTLLQAAASQPVVPAGAFKDEEDLSHAAEPLQNVAIAIPVLMAEPARMSSGEVQKIDVWVRDSGDRLPHASGWMAPEIALAIPEAHYEEYPLALTVDVPEPRTVTVFETASYDQPAPSTKVMAITDAPKAKRFAIPNYIKGMAAGLMLASFLWFGSSSIKTGGMTMRPGDLIRLTIQRRATYEVGDNFHAGLVSWDGGKNFTKTWIYDKDGFIRPGRLALFKPSHDMSDYKLEFLTQVERKGMGWVFRAADNQNYYAMKLDVTQPGPRPLVALVRYQVIDGKKESRGETPLQVMMHNNQPYRVEVDVKGNTFLTSIEGQLVDSWSDDRLKSGGVGFFTEGSEKARLYWMKITKNSDFLGKLCSILVPKES